MYCPRLDHFMRFNPNGTISRCGHMVTPAQFESLDAMESSEWLANIKKQFVQEHNFNHSYALLEYPAPLNVAYTNQLTIQAREKFKSSVDSQLNKMSEFVAANSDDQHEFNTFVKHQDQLRGINISNFIK